MTNHCRPFDLYEKLGPCNEKMWFHYEFVSG